MWNNEVWDHIVDGGAVWHRADEKTSLSKLTSTALAVVSDQDEAWLVACYLTTYCNLHFTWADNSGPGFYSAFEEYSASPTSVFAVLRAGSVDPENFESDWGDNQDALPSFGGGDITVGGFKTDGADDNYEGFEIAITMNVPLTSSTAGTEIDIDPSHGVRVTFSGTLVGQLRLEGRRSESGTWLTLDTIDPPLSTDVDVEAGYKQLRIYTVTYSSGSPAAVQKYEAL
jgi:hypothetical protein